MPATLGGVVTANSVASFSVWLGYVLDIFSAN
jgi:hypothetical protein